MRQKWRSVNDKVNSFGALFTDLSKAFDCLFIAKLVAYGFSQSTLKLM